MFHVEQFQTSQIISELLKSPAYPREMAKRLGVSHTTIIRRLKNLLDENVVDYRNVGKNKVYHLKNTIESRINIYQAEYSKLERVVLNYPILRPIINKIQDNEDVELAILFGSYAKGTCNSESDIDIYIETEDRLIKKELERLNSKLSIKIGLWDENNLLIQEIIKDHIIIKGVEKYYERRGFFK
ncbi:nucleotidyltransferase domain-containing protein [Methanoplanus limicola]|uniref:DNA polymerase beta domain protein region n=1 Tax=Methanoplanus limicola DSM 2279 TaxID=937775 RepID=H1Z0X6_9EURY|nr:nucleotidyltransferase domain-containing protein [Methanoplanus limicola]EHQ34452.1 DNA polymerase beta domain protein region [Methanoplanus limicola DSM 2279]